VKAGLKFDLCQGLEREVYKKLSSVYEMWNSGYMEQSKFHKRSDWQSGKKKRGKFSYIIAVLAEKKKKRVHHPSNFPYNKYYIRKLNKTSIL